MLINTSNLLIRPFEEKDIDTFVEATLESQTTVGLWMPWCTSTYSVQDASAWFDVCTLNLQINEAYDVGIFSMDNNSLLGGISINQINWDHKVGNIGYWVRQSQQKKGIASQAVLAIAQFGFTELKLQRLEIVAVVDNIASRKVAEKVGATFECVARNRLDLFGNAYDAAVYSLIHSDFTYPAEPSFATPSKEDMQIEGVSHITFIVQDVERMAQFLCEGLGAREVYDSKDRNFSLSREKFFILGNTWLAAMEGTSPTERTYQHLAFKVPPETLPYFEQRLRSIEVEVKEARSRVEGEGSSLYFYDFDNHLFELHTGRLEERLQTYKSNS